MFMRASHLLICEQYSNFLVIFEDNLPVIELNLEAKMIRLTHVTAPYQLFLLVICHDTTFRGQCPLFDMVFREETRVLRGIFQSIYADTELLIYRSTCQVFKQSIEAFSLCGSQ
jgi:hypothetical protein